MPESTVPQAKQKVRETLAGSFDDVVFDDDGGASFRYGSAHVFVKVKEFDEDSSVIVLESPVVQGTKATPELYEYVATQSADQEFGHLALARRGRRRHDHLHPHAARRLPRRHGAAGGRGRGGLHERRPRRQARREVRRHALPRRLTAPGPGVLLVVRQVAAGDVDEVSGWLWSTGRVTMVVEAGVGPGFVDLRVGLVDGASADEVRATGAPWLARRGDRRRGRAGRGRGCAAVVVDRGARRHAVRRRARVGSGRGR